MPPKGSRRTDTGGITITSPRAIAIRKTVSSKKPASQSAAQLAEAQDRAKQIIKILKATYPIAECALLHATPFQLLTATILSAQCTDERVNAVTPKLFAAYPTPASLAAAAQADVERIVHSLGFFRAKAANIIGMASAVVERFGGELPRTIEELTSLPGVGRKTANVLLGTAFGIASGVVVDTHVRRISNLLGLTANADPERIERDLMEILPQREWVMYSHRVIHHGRKLCIARRPKCDECPLLPHCPRAGLPPFAAGNQAAEDANDSNAKKNRTAGASAKPFAQKLPKKVTSKRSAGVPKSKP